MFDCSLSHSATSEKESLASAFSGVKIMVASPAAPPGRVGSSLVAWLFGESPVFMMEVIMDDGIVICV